MSIRKFAQSVLRLVISNRLAVAALLPALALGGCVVMPGPDGQPWVVLGGPVVPQQPTAGTPPANFWTPVQSHRSQTVLAGN